MARLRIMKGETPEHWISRYDVATGTFTRFLTPTAGDGYLLGPLAVWDRALYALEGHGVVIRIDLATLARERIPVSPSASLRCFAFDAKTHRAYFHRYARDWTESHGDILVFDFDTKTSSTLLQPGDDGTMFPDASPLRDLVLSDNGGELGLLTVTPPSDTKKEGPSSWSLWTLGVENPHRLERVASYKSTWFPSELASYSEGRFVVAGYVVPNWAKNPFQEFSIEEPVRDRRGTTYLALRFGLYECRLSPNAEVNGL